MGTMLRGSAAVFALVLALCGSSARAWDGYQNYVPNGVALFNAVASSSGTGCPMCHQTTSGGNACAAGTCPITCTTTNRCHNAFGVLFMAQGATWTQTMARTDSDGDGWSNGQELGDPFARWVSGGSNAYGGGYRSQPGSFASEPASTTNVCTLSLDDCSGLVTCSDAYTGTGGWTCGACPAGYSGSGHVYTSAGWFGGSSPYNIAVGTACSDVNECSLYNRCHEDDFVGINTCSNSIGSYDCVCGSGFLESGTGQSRICGDVDECATLNRCREDDFVGVNTCSNSVGSYDCVCGTGFTETGTGQSRICGDIDECVTLNRCHEDDFVGINTCADVDGSYDCVCGSGFSETGTGQSRMCADVDECATLNRCHEDDFLGTNTCSNSLGTYDCVCGTGFTETGTGQSRVCADVDECATLNRCHEDDFPGVNSCSNVLGSYDCVCGTGFTETGTGQSRVCADVNECASNPCGAQGTGCTNTTGAYTCTCSPGYAFDGTSCVVANPCLIPGGPSMGGNDCDPNATCKALGGTSYSCTCGSGYTGTGYVATGGCTNVDECASSATNDCDAANATCTDLPGTFLCGCAPGFTGDGRTNCVDVDECLQPVDVCPGNAICSNAAGTYRCTNCSMNGHVVGSPGSESCACDAGYTGDGFTCTDVNECVGTVCQPNEACANAVGSYACIACDPNASVDASSGVDRCVCHAGYAGTGTVCTDVDECALGTDDCAAQASCTNTVGSFSCQCNTGYTGDGTVCGDVDECTLQLHDCDPNATCANTVGSFTCACIAGWSGTGKTCADVDECALGTDRCSLSADCTNTAGSHTCACKTGFLGDGIVCVDVDDCPTTTCGAGQRCVNQLGLPATCECLPGFTDVGDGTCRSACGNGEIVAGEGCDDGNATAGDGCSPTCVIEAGFACHEPDYRTSVCMRTCGDGLIDPPYETCDDGLANSDTTPGACRSTCRLAGCGDGLLDPGEGCDQGAGNADDVPGACRSDCRPAFCGDGVVDSTAGEVCDPGGGSTLEDVVCADPFCTALSPDAGITHRKRGGCVVMHAPARGAGSQGPALAGLALALLFRVRRRR